MHDIIGQTFTYHAEYPPYDPDLDREGGVLILGNGFPVVVKALAKNDTLLYVFVPATGYHTHILPADLRLVSMFDTEANGPDGYALSDCQWWDDKRRAFDCWGRVGKTGDGMYSVLCEGHFNNKAAR